MNTPAHVVLSFAVLGKREISRASHAAILVGALLPDAPMFLFYFVEKILLRTRESVIWGERYFADKWQNFFDVFNSLPLIATLFLLALGIQSRMLALLALSMALHVALDLPLHHDDGHRHFFPFSDWRFASPVSYWDPAHYGSIVASIEAGLVLCGCVWLCVGRTTWFIRTIALVVLVAYLSYVAYALTVWVGMDEAIG